MSSISLYSQPQFIYPLSLSLSTFFLGNSTARKTDGCTTDLTSTSYRRGIEDDEKKIRIIDSAVVDAHRSAIRNADSLPKKKNLSPLQRER